MQQSDVEAQVLALIRESVHEHIEPDTRLIHEGLLDSFAAIELVGNIEERFDVEFNPEHVQPQHFDSPAAIARLVYEMKAGAPADGEPSKDALSQP